MMAVDLHRGRELLLLSRFLADNNNNNNNEAHNNNNNSNIIILSNNNASSTPNHTNTDFNVPNNNGLQPPFGSSSQELASFTETETDEEEDDGYIAEFSRQMASYMFQDDDKLNSRKIDESWGLAGFPHSSVLCSPNHGIPKWSRREPSPPTTPEILKQRTGSGCEIMEKLEHLKISNEGSKIPQLPPHHQQQFQSMVQNPSSTPVSVDNPSVGLCSNQALLDQIRAIQFYKMKQEQLLKQQTKELQHPQFQKKNRGYASGSVNGVGSRPTPWVNQQQQSGSGSGMRAVFLGGSSSTSTGGGSSGTGVFLPCVIGNTTTNQSRKKRGCSPVLIPAKVVQALRVHFDRMGYNISDLPEASSTFPLQHDSYRSSGGRSSQKCPENKRHSRAVPTIKHNEKGLPQEWTY